MFVKRIIKLIYCLICNKSMKHNEIQQQRQNLYCVSYLALFSFSYILFTIFLNVLLSCFILFYFKSMCIKLYVCLTNWTSYKYLLCFLLFCFGLFLCIVCLFIFCCFFYSTTLLVCFSFLLLLALLCFSCN